MIRVQQFALDVNYVNAYLCYETESREAFLVDCGAVPSDLASFLQEHGLELKFVLLTHTHSDHTDGLRKLRKQFPVPVYANAGGYDHRVSDGDRISFAGRDIRVLETHGHTTDHVCYHIADVVFVGDALFAGAVGGTTTRSNHRHQVGAVARKVFTLPDDTIVYPGHGAPTSVGVERIYNPFFV